MRKPVQPLASLSGLGIRHAMGCGVGRRRDSDPELLWLWCRPVATAPIWPLAWEPPYATGVAQEKAKRPKNKETNKKAISILPTQEHSISFYLFVLFSISFISVIVFQVQVFCLLRYFIPRYFILFDVMVESTDSLMVYICSTLLRHLNVKFFV